MSRMKFGVLRNIAGNIEALKDADRRFDELGVDAKVCLGQIVGLYPYINDCVEFLIARKYLALRHGMDQAFLDYSDGTEDFRYWTIIHWVEAVKFAQRSVSVGSLEFLRGLPQRLVIDGVAFESCLPVTVDRIHALYEPERAAAAFAAWENRIVIHAVRLDAFVWHEDLTGVSLSTGQNQLVQHGRLLISTGGVGTTLYSTQHRETDALVYDDVTRSVHLLRPMCDVRKIFDSLRRTEYPRNVLRRLEEDECEAWRNPMR